MIIKLNVFPNGSCAQIYAYAENHEDEFLFENQSTRTIKIWHNKDSLSLHPSLMQLNSCHNDYLITFKSNVPFKEFCEKFSSSEFNEPSQYHFLSHNCSHAANYALKLAGIDLQISNGIRPTRIFSPEIPISIPLKALSPSDLYCIAKNYKVKMLKDENKPLSHIDFKTELASHALRFLVKKIDDKIIKDNASTIEQESVKNIKDNMHHAEFYLKALIDTINVISGVSKKFEIERYKDSSSFFKTRALSHSKEIQRQHLMIVAPLVLVADALTYFVNDKIRPVLRTAITTISLTASIAYIYRSLNAVIQEGFDHVPTAKSDTPLSKAIMNLGSQIEEEQQTLAFKP